MLAKRRAYKVRERRFMHSLGCEAPGVDLRQSVFRMAENERYLNTTGSYISSKFLNVMENYELLNCGLTANCIFFFNFQRCYFDFQ